MESMTNKNCGNLYGIYFNDPEYDCIRYLHGFSFDTNVLYQMLEKIDQNEQKYYSIEPVKLYQCLEVLPHESKNKFSDRSNIVGIIVQLNSVNSYDEIKYPIYGYNFMKNNKYDQILLSVNPDARPFSLMDMSDNPIVLDTFYDESIMNA